MDVPLREKGIFGFAAFRLDPMRRTLTHAGTRVQLRQLLFEALQYLVVHHTRIVTRDELRQAVWGGRSVEDNNLGQAISALRRSLREAGATEELIVTVPGRGFQFAAAVTFEPEPVAVGFLDPPSAPFHPPPRRAWRTVPRLAAVSAWVCAATGIWMALWLHHAEPPFEPPPHSLAVLAFSNLTGDPGEAYLADGLSDELTDRLGRLGGLHVAARRSALAFRGGNATVGDIARRLNVGALLDGSVRRAGNRIRVTAQLIDAVSGYQIWSQTFDQKRDDSLAVESALAAAVLNGLKVTLSGADDSQLTLGGTKDPAALDFYLHARAEAAQATLDGVYAAQADYEKAIARDPAYAMAHLGRADMLYSLVERVARPDQAWLNRTAAESESEERRAIALAPDLGAAHAHLASTLAEQHLDFVGALAEAERARTLAPNDARSLMLVAFVQAVAGHVQDAVATANKAAALDPLTPSTYRWLASTFVKARDFHAVQIALHRARALETAANSNDHYLAAVAEYGLGHPEEAVREAQFVDDWGRAEYLAMAYHALGRDAEADHAMADLQKALGDGGALPYAEVYAQWGRTQDALLALQKGMRTHDSDLVILKVDFLLDPVAHTDVFQDIVRQLNFPP